MSFVESEPRAETGAAAEAPWPELDRCFLQGERRVAPPFPVDVIAARWRPWIEGHAQGSTCTDYIAQALLAAVSAVCGSRFVVDVTPHWREPLVLWQALVGAPSTGKTPAMVAARRLVGGIEAPPDTLPFKDDKPRAGDSEITPWMFHRGISSWHDDLDAELAALTRDRKALVFTLGAWTGDRSDSGDREIEVGQLDRRWPESALGGFHADRLAERLSEIDDRFLSRLLYCWPVPRVEARLTASSDGDSARPLLQRLVDLQGSIREPAALALQPAAVQRLQDLLPQLRAFMRDADGVEAAWLGKAAGNIVRLAGLLSLMDWATGDDEAPCATVEEPHLERAYALWADYFWPHAQAVFGQVPTTLAERRVRRVGRWLQRMRPQTVSREEVRREALGQTVDADAAEDVLERLERYGAVRMLPVAKEARCGPRKVRWEVNPELWRISGN